MCVCVCLCGNNCSGSVLFMLCCVVSTNETVIHSVRGNKQQKVMFSNVFSSISRMQLKWSVWPSKVDQFWSGVGSREYEKPCVIHQSACSCREQWSDLHQNVIRFVLWKLHTHRRTYHPLVKRVSGNTAINVTRVVQNGRLAVAYVTCSEKNCKEHEDHKQWNNSKVRDGP